MSMRGSSWAKFLFSLFALLALHISVLINVRKYTTIFIAIVSIAWHVLANVYCAWISSYRFKNPAAKYIEIKNKFIRNIFVRPARVGEVEFTSKNDHRTNVIGFVLNILNIVLWISFEILLFMPKILCDPYVFTFVIGTRPRNYKHFDIVLHSLNEIIPAEGSKAFAVVTALIFFVFVILYERQLKEHRRSLERNTAKTPRQKPKPFKKPTRYTVYSALAIFMVVLGFVILIAMPLLFDNGAIFKTVSDGVLLLCYILSAVVCIAFAVFFFVRAFESEFHDLEWRFELHELLVGIAVRKNNRKFKFWYETDQLEQIENLVKSASRNAELKLETKGNKIISFKVVDTLNHSVMFTGLFT